jgi:hypothetical protein
VQWGKRPWVHYVIVDRGATLELVTVYPEDKWVNRLRIVPVLDNLAALDAEQIDLGERLIFPGYLAERGNKVALTYKNGSKNSTNPSTPSFTPVLCWV